MQQPALQISRPVNTIYCVMLCGIQGVLNHFDNSNVYIYLNSIWQWVYLYIWYVLYICYRTDMCYACFIGLLFLYLVLSWKHRIKYKNQGNLKSSSSFGAFGRPFSVSNAHELVVNWSEYLATTSKKSDNTTSIRDNEHVIMNNTNLYCLVRINNFNLTTLSVAV